MRSRHALKDLAKTKKTRPLNEEEHAACRTVYFSEAPYPEPASGSPVLRIRGNYSYTSSRKPRRITHRYTGGYEVLWHPAMGACVEHGNTAEIAILSDGRGIIISLNNQFFLTGEVKLRALMGKPGAVKAAAGASGPPAAPDAGLPPDTLVLQEAALQKLPEKFKPELGKYLGLDLRVPALLLACTAGLTPFFIDPPAALPAAAVLAVSSVLLLFWKKYPYKPLNQHVYLLTGTILKVIDRAEGAISVSQTEYRMGRFQLNIPRRWLPGLLTGTPVTLRGFPEGMDAVGFRVLSTEGGLSLETLYERNDPRHPVRAMLCRALFAVLAAALFFTPKHPVKAAAIIAAHRAAKELPKDFSGFEEVRAAGSLRAAQEIRVAPYRLLRYRAMRPNHPLHTGRAAILW